MLPNPPFLYDDERITYDEHCFYYDGGYDIICLQTPPEPDEEPKKRVGRAGGRRRYQENRPRRPVVYYNLFCKTLKAVLEDGTEIDLDQEDHVKGHISVPSAEARVTSLTNRNASNVKVVATEIKVPKKQLVEQKINVSTTEIRIKKR